jgi:amidase
MRASDESGRVVPGDDLAALDALGQAELVRRGEVTPAELVTAAIGRIERIDPGLNAVIHPRFERAHDEAAHAPDGPFRGVPIVVKDLDGPLGDEPFHLGNHLLRDLAYTADHDSYLCAKLRDAGFVVVGKTNAPEFGLLPTTEPLANGPTRNPWDPELSPGGSSGGTAAAVAARMVALGHAGDGGGSIRIPASACGLVGLKPTRGRVSLGPDEGEAWSGLVVRHVLTRTVRDTAAVLDVLAGPMPGDPYSAPAPERPFLHETRAIPRRLRIGLRSDTAPGGIVPVDAACRATAERAGALLEECGHDIEPASPSALDDVSLLGDVLTIIATGVACDVARLARIAGREIGADDVEPMTWALYEQGRTIAAADYALALESLHAWSRTVARWWHGDVDSEGFDLLLTPTMASPAARIGEVRGDDVNALAAATPYAAFTLPFNATGQPAISVPLGWDHAVPIGVQLVAPTGREDLLVQIASQLEAAAPWSVQRPRISA